MYLNLCWTGFFGTTLDRKPGRFGMSVMVYVCLTYVEGTKRKTHVKKQQKRAMTYVCGGYEAKNKRQQTEDKQTKRQRGELCVRMVCVFPDMSFTKLLCVCAHNKGQQTHTTHTQKKGQQTHTQHTHTKERPADTHTQKKDQQTHTHTLTKERPADTHTHTHTLTK